jgi:hypothetical protein
MDLLLNKMGVPEDVQQFFGCAGLRFAYGDKLELFTEAFHYVPTTSGVCRCGTVTARFVFLSHSVMEAIAYLTLKRHRYPKLDTVACIALGNLPCAGQLKEIASIYAKSKFILLFGNDLPGKAMDIFVACGLRGFPIRFELQPEQVLINCNGRSMGFTHGTLSLNAFQQMFGIRTLCRTEKARIDNTFLLRLLSIIN